MANPNMRARANQDGGAGGHHVGTRTQVKSDSTYASIADTKTDNRLRCAYCNSTAWEIKSTHYVDRDETHPRVSHSGNEGGATSDCLITICLVCGREHTWDPDTTTDWTDQVHS